MKTLNNFIIIVFCVTLFHACNSIQTTQSATETEASTTEYIDSLALQLQYLDSITNCGSLIHMDIYEIGDLKSIGVSVHSVDVEDTSFQYVNFRKDCGSKYYYSWENARLMLGECQYLLSAIDTIKANIERVTEHEERYAYVTKDNIRLFASNKGGKNWNISFSVDYNKDNATISLTTSELEKLVILVKDSISKLEEIKK